MVRWRQEDKIWCNWPTKPIGLIEVIGGSYFSASPQISYKYLLESLEQKGLAIHALSYLPSFDHQSQANEAWRNFRNCKKKLERRVNENLKIIRLGHSLGCKLHLLSPDNGRNASAFISLSFNNFNATKSIPMLSKVTSKLKFETEFSPSPTETMNLILERYLQPNNLLINFSNDRIDQSLSLFNCLKTRDNDNTTRIELKGNHLTPISTGFTKDIFNEFDINRTRNREIEILLGTILSYSLEKLCP
tara:strand:+ start:4380 stop:5120 length:741 start_codon:yes stop_codon:yes gene_type:complete